MKIGAFCKYKKLSEQRKSLKAVPSGIIELMRKIKIG